MVSEGVNTAVATFGAEVTADQYEILKRFESVVLFFDGDLAGRKATEDAGKALIEDCRVFVAQCDEDQDPGDMDRRQMDRRLSQKVPYSIWS
jgi:DNA primase